MNVFKPLFDIACFLNTDYRLAAKGTNHLSNVIEPLNYKLLIVFSFFIHSIII